MIKSYLVRIILGGVIAALIALGASLIAPKKYEGFVQILVDQKAMQPNVPLSTAERSVSDFLDFSRSRSLTTSVLQLTSWQTLLEAGQNAVQELNVPADKRGEFAPDNMRDNVFVDAEAGSDFITFRVHMSSPEYARKFAEETYLAFERQNERTSAELAERARNVLEGSMVTLKKDMEDIDTKVKALREQYDVPILDTMMVSDVNQIQQLKQVRDNALLDREAIRGRMEKLNEELASVPREVLASQTAGLNTNILVIEQGLTNARAERDRLLERYTPEREEIKQLNAQIKRLEEDLRNTKGQVDQGKTTTINPVWQSLASSAAEARAQYLAAQQRAAEAESTYNAASPILKRYPEVQRQLQQLARDQASIERQYLAYDDQLRALKLAQNGRNSPTRLITPGSAREDAISPKPLQNSLIGFVLGVVVAALFAVRKEAADMPIRTMAQLNALSLVPAYRNIPALRAPFRGLNRTPHESYEKLVLNCLKSETKPYRVAIFGVTRDSGASLASVNYALSVARRGLKATIVMADGKSSLKRVMKAGVPDAGKTKELADGVTVLNATEMTLIEAGAGNVGLSQAIQSVESDATIFDVEPALNSADYAILAQIVDEAIVLVRADKTKSVDFAATQQALRDAGCKQITVVFSFSSGAAGGVEYVERQEELSALPS